MPHPILFPIRKLAARSTSRLGSPRLMVGYLPQPGTKLLISGITKDSTDAVLGSCTVRIYRTRDDVLVDTAISDAVTGAYAFSVSGDQAYYVVAYKAGAPDVSGTTVNTLLGVA